MFDNNVSSDNKDYINKHYLLSSSTLPNTPSTKESVYYNTGRWSEEEHHKFLEGILEYGNEWKKVQNLIGTRSSTQARSHAQKFFLRIKKALQNENDETKDNSVMKYFFDILNNNGQVVSQNEHMQNVITNNNNQHTTTTGHFTASQKEKIINLIMKFNGGDDYMPAKKKENFTNNNIVNGINNNNSGDNNNNNIELHQHQQPLYVDSSNTNSYYHDINNNEMEIDEDSCSLSSSSTPLRYNAGNSSIGSNNNKIFRIDKGIRHKYSIDCLYKKTSNTFMNNYFHNNQLPPSPNTNRIYEEMKSFFTKPQHSVTSTSTKNGIMMLSKRPRFNSSASASIDINFLDNKNFQDKPSPNPSRNSFNSTDKHSHPNNTNTYTKLISNPFVLEFDTTEIKEDLDNENCNIFEEHLSPY